MLLVDDYDSLKCRKLVPRFEDELPTESSNLDHRFMSPRRLRPRSGGMLAGACFVDKAKRQKVKPPLILLPLLGHLHAVTGTAVRPETTFF